MVGAAVLDGGAADQGCDGHQPDAQNGSGNQNFDQGEALAASFFWGDAVHGFQGGDPITVQGLGGAKFGPVHFPGYSVTTLPEGRTITDRDSPALLWMMIVPAMEARPRSLKWVA